MTDTSNVIFSIVFIVEALAKIWAFGFFMPTDVEHDSYWQDGWNRLDFVVVCFSVADMAGLGEVRLIQMDG